MVPLVSRKLVTAVAVIGAVLPVAHRLGRGRLLLRRYAALPGGMAQTPGAAYRNYNRIYGNANDTKYVCYGPAGTGDVLRGTHASSATPPTSTSGTSGAYGYGTAAAKCGTT